MGILEVTNGAVLTSGQRYVVAAPANPEGSVITGERWTLTLQPGWVLRRGELVWEISSWLVNKINEHRVWRPTLGIRDPTRHNPEIHWR